MTTPSSMVEIFFEVSPEVAFVLDDPVKGKLDDATYTLGGAGVAGVATDVTASVRHVTTQRGRSRQLDEIQAGTLEGEFNNHDRTFDPLYASSPYTGNIKPRRRVRVTTSGLGVIDARIDDWNLSYEVGGDSTAAITAIDALGVLASKKLTAFTATGSQTAGTRLDAILDRSEVAFGANRSLGTGISVLQGDAVEADTNALEYAQLVTRSDAGHLFADRDGVLTFKDRHDTLNLTPTVTFADDGTGTAYQNIQLDFGTELLYNRVTIGRVGGTAQTVEDQDAIDALDGDILTLSRTDLLQSTDAQALDMANWLLGIYKDPTVRVASLTVNLARHSEVEQLAILGLDLAHAVTVKFTPNSVGTQIERRCLVEGIRHDIAPMFHTVTFEFGDADAGAFFVLDDAVLGVLDTGVLAF